MRARGSIWPGAVCVAVYGLLAVLPYALGTTSRNVAYRTAFTEAATLASMAGMMLMLLQFGLSGRIGPVSRMAGVDASVRTHRGVGETLALVFLLHPLLVVLPRFWVSGRYAPDDLWVTFTGPLTATGFYAWALLLVWVLLAMFRDRSGLSYEAWRISHGVGAAAIAILATDHVTVVGRHGHYADDVWMDWVWIGACAAAIASLVSTYLLRPWQLRRRLFRVVSVKKAGRSDWCLTLRQETGRPLAFAAGQFVWLNSSSSAFHRTEHPFSIASSPRDLPLLSFIIRERGDYTSRLAQLVPGQKIHVEGPEGEFTLRSSGARGIGLLATGAGIGPVLGLLRQLRDQQDSRPIRLVYGNRTVDQLVCQPEILALEGQLDFRQVVAITQPPPGFVGHVGRIDAALVERSFPVDHRTCWDYYVCGSPDAVRSMVEALGSLGVPRGRIVHEQLAF